MGALGFVAPLVLFGLVALPIVWWLLRAVPPAAIRRRFPAVSLLLGIKDAEITPVKTPWWLMALRILALAAVIIGFAGPVLNPNDTGFVRKPLLIVMDAGWASGTDWPDRLAKVQEILTNADRNGQPVALIRLTDRPKDDGALPFGAASILLETIKGLTPEPYSPQFEDWQVALTARKSEAFDTHWFADGLRADGRSKLLSTLQTQGDVVIYQPNMTSLRAIKPATVQGGDLVIDVIRAEPASDKPVTLDFIGPDPSGVSRRLASATAEFDSNATEVSVTVDLPSEMRNRVARIEIRDQNTAGATQLTDDSFQRRKVALMSPTEAQEGSTLSGPLHFLRKALVPTADIIEAPLADVMQANANVIILSDIGVLPETDTAMLTNWVKEGGLLVRFAGPRLAASNLAQSEELVLLPVRLRAGGRSVGGAMSWGAPKRLRTFGEASPFFGLTIPEDVTVESQVLAQPDPTLASRALASLGDGTPLVTAKDLGLGRVVLFHVTSNAEWSNLPLSGLFVEMLDRLAITARSQDLSKGDLAGLIWQPKSILDGFGELADAKQRPGVEGAVLATGIPNPQAHPGVYANGSRQVAFNIIGADTVLQPTVWPKDLEIANFALQEERHLMQWFIALALLLFFIDGFVTILATGGFARVGKVAAIIMAFVFVSPTSPNANDADILAATSDTVLAFVKTGNARLDATSEAGLLGLTTELFRRTSIEPVAPVGLDPEEDDLSVYPFLYWPMSEDQIDLSDAALSRINTYLRTGGMILFDTRDADLGRSFSATVNGRKLQKIARGLEIPPLEPIPNDHVLTRSFYLLQDFPGRYAGFDVWAEAGPIDAEQIEGMPFRNLNDGVTPVVIGGNDWAAAWAIDENGNYLYPVGRGFDGDRQREMAFRFGINLIMHVMTGNYKSDQVHVPELLKRLGQ